MTVIVPKQYHLIDALEKHRVICIDPLAASRENIRSLRIGILNIMPKAETYEFNILHPLGRLILQIEPVWIRLKTHSYSSSDPDHLRSFYIPFEDAIAKKPLDGLILTGAPVEDIPFEKVVYWKEVQEILTYAQREIPATLGICWGGLALAQHIGIDKTLFERKLFGVFETRNIDREHPITGEMDDVFWCPQSRFSGIRDSVLERARDQKRVHLLAHATEAGYTIFESADRRFLMHLGHPEYEAQRLVDEYYRDLEIGKAGVSAPANLDLKVPLNQWKGQCSEFFSQWIKYIHSYIAFSIS